jgi:transcriptional regulator with XRE-family HTH domain
MSGNPILLDPERLRQALSLLGVSQAELARASGVSTTTISLLLSATRIPSQDIAVRLIGGVERAFKEKGCRLDTAFFAVRRTAVDADSQ